MILSNLPLLGRFLANVFRHDASGSSALTNATSNDQAQNRNYLFEVSDDSPLHQAEFTKNPELPPESHPVRIYITHRENGTTEDINADLFFLGEDAERRNVLGRDVRVADRVDAGWIVLLPLEGEYTIHLENLLDENLAATIWVDGSKDCNSHFLGLYRRQKRSVKFHLVKTTDEFEVDPLKAGDALRVPKSFGAIKFSFGLVERIATRPVTPQTSRPPANPPTKYLASKKESITYLSKTVLPEKKPNTPGETVQVWTRGEELWRFSVAYRGEAWARTGGFLPPKYGRNDGVNHNDDDDDDEDDDVDEGNNGAVVPPAPKRQKIETEEGRLSKEAMRSLSYSSSCCDFFSQMATLLGRPEGDFDEVIASLKSKKVLDVADLVKVSDAQFMTTHLPNGIAPTARRNLSNLIRQHLELIQKPVIQIDLADDE